MVYFLVLNSYKFISLQDSVVKESVHYRHVIVFQYGSAVLFNIADHEAERYLDIIRKHASGLVPEMRKDGKLIQ